MKRNLVVIIWILVGILVAALALGGALALFSWFSGYAPSFSVSEGFFGYFGNSIGLSIGAAGTVAAIVLAYNALRTAEIQTTTVALQEFRPEIDLFIENCNTLYFRILDFVDAGLRQNLAAQSLIYAVHHHIHTDKSDIVLHGCTSEGEIRIYASRFFEEKKKFMAAADDIHSVLDGNGNIFFRGMILENLKSCRAEIEVIKELQRKGFYIPITGETPSDAEVVRNLNLLASRQIKSPMRDIEGIDAIKRLIYSIQGAEYTEFSTESLISLIAQQFPHLSLNSIGSDQDDEEHYHFEELDDLCLATDVKFRADCSDYLMYWINSDEDLEGERMLDISEGDMSDLVDIYTPVLRIYVKLAKPDAGIEAMRQHFRKFGAKEDILHLFIDTHEARLAYRFRKETYHLFSVSA